MVAEILFALVCIAVMAVTPFYVNAQRNGPCRKSHFLKMVGATGYLAVGLLGVYISGTGFSAFDKIMLGALIASWIGDLFLHTKIKALVVIGFLGFLSAHFFFISAYSKQISLLAPEQGFFALWQIIVVLALDVAFLIFASKKGYDFKGIIKVGILIYGAVISTMFCKAVSLGVTSIITQAPNGVLTAVVTMSGALLFVMSDFSISILMFNQKQKKNYRLKMFNMITYFAAELLLASLMLIIN